MDFHNPLHVIRRAHSKLISALTRQFSTGSVSPPPLLERSEGMLNSPLSNLHHLWCSVSRRLHFLKHSFMPPNALLDDLAWCATAFQRANSDTLNSVAMHIHAFLNAWKKKKKKKKKHFRE